MIPSFDHWSFRIVERLLRDRVAAEYVAFSVAPFGNPDSAISAFALSMLYG